MNVVMNSVKSNVLNDMNDPLIMTKEMLEAKVRKTSTSKSKVKPLKLNVQVSAFDK